jgi:glutamyl-tRNA reductase
MALLTLGLNHQTAPLALRERVAFLPEQVGTVIAELRERLAARAYGGLSEAAVLSTCNRTEIVCAVEDPAVAAPALADFVLARRPLDAAELRRSSYLLTEAPAVRHAFRVASGLDSMVLGEAQILGQMKQAARLARDAGGLGVLLNHLFQRTFAVAKEVRTSTAIGARSVSMAAAAVRTAERIFGQFDDCHVLFVGAGEMIELCATHFAARHPKSITVANRTVARAEALANKLQGTSLSLSDLPEAIARFDIIVSCTASMLPIVGLGMMERAVRARRHRPIFIADLAVPRDVEAEVARLNDVYVVTVDDLGRMVRSGEQARQAAVAQAEAIIESRVRDFATWVATRGSVPMIRDLRMRADALRTRELERARRALARGDEPDAVLEGLAQSLTNKFLHAPLAALHEAAGGPDHERAQVTRAVDRFYRGGTE